MKSKLMVISASFVLLMACVPAVVAEAWLDKMESYTEESMKSPWTTTKAAPSVAPYSYDGSMAAFCGELDTARDAWRQIVDGAGVSGAGYVCARVKVGGVGSSLIFGVFDNRSAKDGMPNSQNGACFQVDGTADGAKPKSVLVQKGSMSYAAYMASVPWVSDSWYDIAIGWAADHKTLSWSWKLPSETAWKQLTYTVASPVTINYVGVGLKCFSAIDDIGLNTVPETISQSQLQLGTYPIPRKK